MLRSLGITDCPKFGATPVLIVPAPQALMVPSTLSATVNASPAAIRVHIPSVVGTFVCPLVFNPQLLTAPPVVRATE